MIQDLSTEFPVQMLCQVLSLGRSTYYYQPRDNDDLSVLSWIEDVLLRFPTYGCPRITEQLGRDGHKVNHKRVERILRENDLIRVVKRKCKTTNSDHKYRRYPNLVRHLEVTRPDQVWCADITYVQMPRGFAYLAILLDVYTRGLRGWHLGQRLDTDLALTALQKALSRGKPEIHHSDQGVQYAAYGYTDILQDGGVRVSMSAVGRPTDNPYAERVIRTIKEEEVYLADYESFAEAYQRIGHFIEDVYQTRRIHSSLGYLTPVEFEAAYWDAKQGTP
jgi:putative transposase